MDIYELGIIYSSIMITYFTINFHKDSIINSKFFF